MGTRFRDYQPDQQLLLPPDLRDWLPEEHLVYFISDTIDAMDLKAFYAPYEGDGRRNRPYDPGMMLKVLVYGYSVGVFSSRKLARALEEDVAFRVLAAGNFPQHRTICEFRKRHLGDFQDVFVQVVRLAGELGMVKLGTVAVDGSKVKANASKHKAMSYERMEKEEKRIRSLIQRLTRKAQREDEREDARYGPELRGDELPEEIAFQKGRLEKIRAAKRRLEERQKEEDRRKGRSEEDGNYASGVRPQGGRSKFRRKFGEPPPKKQENFTDPDSRIMKIAPRHYGQCYNAQIVVDDEEQLITAVDVGQNAADSGYLVPLLDASKSHTERDPESVLADAGYKSEENFRALEQRDITGYVALGRERKGSSSKKAIDPKRVATRTMQSRLKTEEGQERYKKRKAVVEPVFGWIKSVLGFRSFSLRGHSKVRGEWNLVCLAVNLRRLSQKVQWVPT
jgi:transposase